MAVDPKATPFQNIAAKLGLGKQPMGDHTRHRLYMDHVDEVIRQLKDRRKNPKQEKERPSRQPDRNRYKKRRIT